MDPIYLLTGGNLGNREQNLRLAKDGIARIAGGPGIIQASGLYRTAAWGLAGQPDFLNQALEIRTQLPPLELLHRLQELEHAIGRVRMERYGPRVIDIDILLYGDRMIGEEDLQVPHPRLPDRRFALVPLAEIAPTLVHPVLGKTISQLLEACTDPLRVELEK